MGGKGAGSRFETAVGKWSEPEEGAVVGGGLFGVADPPGWLVGVDDLEEGELPVDVVVAAVGVVVGCGGGNYAV